MIPHELARNPFFQLPWLPAINVGTVQIYPYDLVLVTGVRTSATGTGNNQHSMMLEVVGIDDAVLRSSFDVGALAFSGPNGMWCANQPGMAGSETYRLMKQYGSVTVGDVGLFGIHGITNTVSHTAGQRLAIPRYNLIPATNHIPEEPRIMMCLGITNIPGNIGLYRIMRDTPIVISAQGGYATVDVGDTISLTNCYVEPSSTSLAYHEDMNWYFKADCGTYDYIEVRYDGWYEVHTSMTCIVPEPDTHGTITACVGVRAGATYFDSADAYAILKENNDMYGPTGVYDSPQISGHAIQYFTAGTQVELALRSGVDGMGIDDITLSLRLIRPGQYLAP